MNNPIDSLGYNEGVEVCPGTDGCVVITGKEGDEFHPVAFFFSRERAEQYCELEVDDKCGGTENVAFGACAIEAVITRNRIVCANDYTLDHLALHRLCEAKLKDFTP